MRACVREIHFKRACVRAYAQEENMEYEQYYQALNNQIAQNNSWSAEQAQKQMEFQERMSNTAHQREVADLKAAGLNPVLSASGNGASTPNGASATADPSATGALVQLLTKTIDTLNDNAKAQVLQYGGRVDNTSASGPSSHSNSSRNSSKQALTSTDVQGLTGLDKSKSDVIASVYNGYMGYDNPSINKAQFAYKTGKYIKDTSVPAAEIDYEHSKKPGEKTGLQKTVDFAKKFGKWLFTVK